MDTSSCKRPLTYTQEIDARVRSLTQHTQQVISCRRALQRLEQVHQEQLMRLKAAQSKLGEQYYELVEQLERLVREACSDCKELNAEQLSALITQLEQFSF